MFNPNNIQPLSEFIKDSISSELGILCTESDPEGI